LEISRHGKCILYRGIVFCIVFLIDHFTKIIAHNKFKELEKIKRSTTWYLAFLCIIGTFQYLFKIVKVFELFVLFGGQNQGAIPVYIMVAAGAVLFIFIMKYSTYVENREKEKLVQIKKKDKFSPTNIDGKK